MERHMRSCYDGGKWRAFHQSLLYTRFRVAWPAPTGKQWHYVYGGMRVAPLVVLEVANPSSVAPSDARNQYPDIIPATY